MTEQDIRDLMRQSWADALTIKDLKTDEDRKIAMAVYITDVFKFTNVIEMIQVINQAKQDYEDSLV